MDARTQSRLMIARRLTRALRHQDFRSSLATCSEGVPRPIIAALPDDRVSDVFNQLARYDCSATLVTPVGEDRLAIVALYPAACAVEGSDGHHEGGEDCPIHRDTEIGMLLLYLRTHPHLRCTVVSPACEMELVDDGDDLTVPA